MESRPGSVSKLFPLGQRERERVSSGLNSPYVTAKQRSRLGASGAETSEVRRFWAMRKPTLTIARNGIVNLWAFRGCRKK